MFAATCSYPKISGNAAAAIRRCAPAVVVLPLLLLLGCSAGVMNAQRQLDALHARGDYHLAAKFLEEPEIISAYEADEPRGKDTVLWELERGSVALATDDSDRALTLFNNAEARTRYNYERTSAESLSTWVFNDTVPEYRAAAYEDQYVNVFKILAYLRLGQIEGKATAEARRFSDKARFLRESYGRFYKAVEQETDRRFAKDAASVASDDPRIRRYERAENAGDFIESPLGAYLSAISFLKTPGEADAQRGAALRLLDAVQQQGRLVGDVDPAHFSTLAEARPSDTNTLAVAFSGRGPVKEKDEFGPIFLWYTTIKIVLPRLRLTPSIVTGAALETSGGERFEMHLVEDMSRVAAENFEREMPAIYSRTMLRVFAKAAAVGVATVATDSASRRGRDNGGAIAAQLGVRALGFLYMWLSEDADTRGWTMLPGQAWVGNFKLPPGSQTVRVVYSTSRGTTIAQPWREITVPDTPDGLTTVVEHCPD